MSTKHTPDRLYATGVHVQSAERNEDNYICKAEGDTPEQAEANAARLVHCWNCHDELLAELWRFHDLPIDDEGNRVIPPGFMDSTRALITKATNPS